MAKQELDKAVMEHNVSGKVVSAFLSITPQLLVVSLVGYATAITGFNFFFNPSVPMDIIGACIMGLGSVFGMWTMFLSVHLFVEGKLFDVLYANPQDAKTFDDAVQFFWSAHRKDRSLQSRWEGTRKIYFQAIVCCLLQWGLTLVGFALTAAAIQH